MSHAILKTSTLALTAVLALAGCASTSQMEKLQADVQQAQATADQAAADAAAAMAKADQADATANTALSTAERAEATSKDTEARIDRMFKKAMYK
jgi:murein lipoprotein